ncbi:hypothetical protein QVD17_35078 [Tagetes erecta]|uniref:Uncharacterized protein n=1 Tax=Tagetes erecta TaxID=13708 RepID=A0AAD8K2W5_TARER|nr:hypothetical protein QVD17_35078 [Tagetes erecta]
MLISFCLLVKVFDQTKFNSTFCCYCLWSRSNKEDEEGPCHHLTGSGVVLTRKTKRAAACLSHGKVVHELQILHLVSPTPFSLRGEGVVDEICNKEDKFARSPLLVKQGRETRVWVEVNLLVFDIETKPHREEIVTDDQVHRVVIVIAAHKSGLDIMKGETES